MVRNTAICDNAIQAAKDSGKSIKQIADELVAKGVSADDIDIALIKIKDKNWLAGKKTTGSHSRNLADDLTENAGARPTDYSAESAEYALSILWDLVKEGEFLK